MATQRFTAEKVVAGGVCMGKVGGKNVFVPYAIPGEVYEIETVESRRDYDRARIVRILERSPGRVEPRCPLYGRCGGCSLQHIDAEFQVRLRKQILQEAFLRAGVEIPEIGAVAGNGFGYRARVQLNGGGFSGRGTNETVAAEGCPVATEEINRWLAETPAESRPKGRCHLFGDARVLNSGGFVLAHERERSREIRIEGAGEKRRAKVKARRNVHFSGTVADARNEVAAEILGRRISFDALGFFQSNLGALEKAIPLIAGGSGGRNALDAYAGCGTFSVFLADSFENVALVEHNRDALVFAEKNLSGRRHESFGQPLSAWAGANAALCERNHGAFDLAVVDPPRQGMDSGFLKWLCGSDIPEIRSVSCDASTHARDAKALVEAGYELKELHLLDFYPQTAHTESLAVFVRK